MLTFSFGEKFSQPCALLLGGFDGLHAGHMSLLAAAKRTGLPVVLTSMYGGKGKALFTREERSLLFARAGICAVCEVELEKSLREMPAETFAREIFSTIDARAVFCGEDFRFGKDALGTPEILQKYAACEVFSLPILMEGGKKLSTSLIKEMLEGGELAMCESLHAGYFLQGVVEHGREVGRTYGFPTLNLTPPPEKLLPPDGVYMGVCETPEGNFPTIVNIGARPTFGVEARKIEAYLDGFSGDLYGATVRIFPTKFLRGIQKFPSAEALKEQLMRDIEQLRGNV